MTDASQTDRVADEPRASGKPWSAPQIHPVTPVHRTQSGGGDTGPETIFYDIS